VFGISRGEMLGVIEGRMLTGGESDDVGMILCEIVGRVDDEDVLQDKASTTQTEIIIIAIITFKYILKAFSHFESPCFKLCYHIITKIGRRSYWYYINILSFSGKRIKLRQIW
jgi:hypothetical protein